MCADRNLAYPSALRHSLCTHRRLGRQRRSFVASRSSPQLSVRGSARRARSLAEATSAKALSGLVTAGVATAAFFVIPSVRAPALPAPLTLPLPAERWVSGRAPRPRPALNISLTVVAACSAPQLAANPGAAQPDSAASTSCPSCATGSRASCRSHRTPVGLEE